MHRTLFGFIVISLVFGMSGCIGIGYIVSAERNVQFNPDLNDGVVRNGIHLEQYSKEALVDMWGEPSEKIITNKGREGWVYNNRVAWGGIIPVLIVPIPLVVPIGYRSTTIYFEDDITNGTLYEYGEMPMSLCSIIPMMWLVRGSTNNWCHKFERW